MDIHGVNIRHSVFARVKTGPSSDDDLGECRKLKTDYMEIGKVKTK